MWISKVFGSKFILFICALNFGGIAFAQFIVTQQIGDFTFTSGTDVNGNCVNGSSIRIGNSVFHNYNTSGEQTISGSTLNVGDTAFHNLSSSGGDLISGTSQYVGDFGFHDFSDLNGNVANGTSVSIGETTFSNINSPSQPTFLRGSEPENAEQVLNGGFSPAKFTFGETKRPSQANADGQETFQIFDKTPDGVSAAGVLVSPSEKRRSHSSGLTLDEMYARAAEAVKNKRFVMVAKVAGIYDTTHQMLLDTRDTIKFTVSEFRKVRKWKIGDLVSVSEWVDDKGDFVDYEFEVYGTQSARSSLIE